MHEIIKYRKNYIKPNYNIYKTNMIFTIHDKQNVTVINTSEFKQNSKFNSILLDGEAKLIKISLDNKELSLTQYTHTKDGILLENLPSEFTLEITTVLNPEENKSCMGLFSAHDNLFTQCEPQGFRKITYFIDRPDVLSIFTVNITAPKKSYPTLLSNGNIISQSSTKLTHSVSWYDPFPKPCYLFALVAGDFAKISREIKTKSGRNITLEIYSEASSIDKCDFALESLVNAIRFDEERFNLEYDLDTYMIVATSFFNAGAMENKGLNVFNTKYVLANKEIATDNDFVNVEAVIGHEYFHNWTGNRVTCRDWFQLSLKEGLTVFRDQEFTANRHDATVKRIKDVKLLRNNQFPEDASNLSHPIRPDSYIEMNNFYTLTVYEKGAEIIRMYQTILGKDGFNKGLALYLAKHDGTAATCNDFFKAMNEANDTNLGNFKLWYSQSGTPVVKCSTEYSVEKSKLYLTVEQINADSHDQKNKEPMLIPIRFALFSKLGKKIELSSKDISGNHKIIDGEILLLLDSAKQIFKFKDVEADTIPSILRDFSAPVILDYDYTIEQLVTLSPNDDDYFNSYEATQRIYRYLIIEKYSNNLDDKQYNKIIKQLILSLTGLINSELNPELIALISSTPTAEEMIPNIHSRVDVHRLLDIIQSINLEIFTPLSSLITNKYQELFDQIKTKYDYNEKGLRTLKNHYLNILGTIKNKHVEKLAAYQYQASDNMTDRIAALSVINHQDNETRVKTFAHYPEYYSNEQLAMDKWFALQAISTIPNQICILESLKKHPSYDATNPNKVYALVNTFTHNAMHFNTKDGYQFIANQIKIIDKFNSSVASRIASGFAIINKLDKKYMLIALPCIKDILRNNPSDQVAEVLSKIIHD